MTCCITVQKQIPLPSIDLSEANVTELVWIYPEVAIGREDFATAAHRCGVELGGDTRRIDDWFDRLHKSFSLPLLPREVGCVEFLCA